MTTPNGLLLIDKPQGLTSHDVVARVRRALKERKVGHAGTLDPMATGLLVVAVGPATRLLRFAQGQDKVYTGTVRLGIATDSLDADGAVLDTQPVPTITSSEADAAAASLTGPIEQVPPMVSALKVNGKRLHELAREGIEVERAPRAITITDFSVSPTDDPAVWDFEVHCSVGTYVRVLLADWAARLGTIGHLTALRRVSSGDHHVADALSIEQLQERCEADERVLEPALSFVDHLTTVTASPEDLVRLRRGQLLMFVATETTSEVAVVDGAGILAGIVHRRGDGWQPDLVFPEEQPC